MGNPILTAVLLLSLPPLIPAHQTTATAASQAPETRPPQPGQLAQAVRQEESPRLPDAVSAPPLTIEEKFKLHMGRAFGFRGFVGSAFSAAVGQWNDEPYEWAQGARGYGLRYGSSFAGNISRQTFAWALESGFHEDPRYFPSLDKSKKSRLLNAFKQVVICRKDSGRPEFAYARVVSAFGSGALTSVWQPRSDSSVADGLERGLISLGADATFNLMHEFLHFTLPASLRNRAKRP